MAHRTARILIMRRLFTALSIQSLVLFLFVVALWVSTFRWELFCTHTSMSPEGPNWRWREWQLWSQDGGVRFHSETFLINDPSFADQWTEKPGQWQWKVQPSGTSGPLVGFPQNLRPTWETGPMPPGVGGSVTVRATYAAAFVPYGCLLVAAIPLPLAWVVQWRRRVRSARTNLCTVCGYNLTGNTSGVCPECGTSTAMKVGT